jgi:predicted MPP superfamily phosphohydrolase
MRFILILLFYGGIQAYFAAKLIHATNPAWVIRFAVVGFAILMTVGPLLLWRLERCAECHAVAVTGAWLVYGWMGLSFLFFWVGMVWEVYRVIARWSGLPALAPGPALAALSAVAIALWAYGFYVARHPRIEQITIRSAKLPAGFPGLRIVQISDVHLGVLAGRQRLDAILKQVAALHPDVLVSTGDLVDAQAHYLDGLSARFAAYQPRYGKFAVTGNHEHYAGLAHSVDFHRRSGFTLLREDRVDLPDNVTLVGVDDPAVLGGATGEAGILAGIPHDRFVILLKHQPVVAADARFDLQLSGHTHAGQLFPFNFAVRQVYPMIQGLYRLPNGGELYVNRGTGTWGPPIRILAPAEITLITLQAP